MRICEHLQKANNPQFSLEIVPPLRGRTGKIIIDIVEKLKIFNPPFIDVTSHSAYANYEELKDGMIKRTIRKKRPGTIGICGVIQNRFQIDTVAHLLCRGFTQEESEDALIELAYLGISNVFALRGDDINYKKQIDKNRHVNLRAAGLVKQITDLRRGKYIEDILNAEPMDFCIGVAGYPEKHFEAPNLKTDIQYLKEKVEAGANYIVTQMFFDNEKYFSFIKQCRAAGITVPIIPGLKIIHHKRQLSSIPRNFHIDFPDELVDEIMENPQHTEEIGFRWTIKQSEALLNAGEKHIHYYVMNDADSLFNLLQKL